jgi:hypothetical protein
MAGYYRSISPVGIWPLLLAEDGPHRAPGAGVFSTG